MESPRLEDEVIGLNLHLLGSGNLERLCLRNDVEANDDGVAGRCQQDVGLRDAARPFVQDLQRNGLRLDFLQLILDRVQGRERVCLEDEGQLLFLLRLLLGEQFIQRHGLLLVLRKHGQAFLLPLLVDEHAA